MKFLFWGLASQSIANLARLLAAPDLVQAFLFEHQRVALELGDHPIAGNEVALQDPLRQRIFDLRLDSAFQRPRAVHRIEARLADLVTRIVVKPERDIALCQALS